MLGSDQQRENLAPCRQIPSIAHQQGSFGATVSEPTADASRALSSRRLQDALLALEADIVNIKKPDNSLWRNEWILSEAAGTVHGRCAACPPGLCIRLEGVEPRGRGGSLEWHFVLE